MQNKKRSKEAILVLILVLVVAILTILSPDKFLKATNIRSMAFQLPEFGLLALAMMVTILTGGINLSVVTTATMGGIISASVLSKLYAAGVGASTAIFLAILSCIVSAALCGALNGYVVAYIGAAPMMATLGTSTLFEGIGLLISKGNSVSGFPTEFFWFGNGTVLGIPVPMLIFVAAAVLTYILLERTPWGLSIYMVGSNQRASEFSGLNVKKITMMAYVYSGLLGGLAMIIMMSRYNSARIDYGSSYLMQTVAASVLGGTLISGGYGKVAGVVLATTILQCISSGLNIWGLDKSLTTMITGGVLIGVLAIGFIAGLLPNKAKTVCAAPAPSAKSSE